MSKLFSIKKKFLYILKHYKTTSTHRYSSRVVFKQYQEHGQRCSGLGDLNMTNKRNKLTFLNREISYEGAPKFNVFFFGDGSL
jgi:hypothetical protein